MNTKNMNDVISILNDLIQTCWEGQEGFWTAAENTRNSEYRRLANILSQQRAQFVKELQGEVHRLGGNLQTPGRMADRFEHGWTNLGVAVAHRDEGFIVAECERSEDAAVHNYEEALKAALPLNTYYLIKRQYLDMKDAFDRIRMFQLAA